MTATNVQERWAAFAAEMERRHRAEMDEITASASRVLAAALASSRPVRVRFRNGGGQPGDVLEFTPPEQPQGEKRCKPQS